MTNPYRAMCAELIEAVLSDDSHIDCMQIARRARALLAEPVVEGPSEKELYDLFCEHAREPVESMRAALARWGRPATAPVPEPGEVAELVEWLGNPMLVSYSLAASDSASRRLIRAAELLGRPAAAPVPEPGEVPRIGHILRLAEIIREVDGRHDKGAAALAEAILSHPGICSAGLAALDEADGPAVPDGREPASVALQPSDEELLATLNQAVADFPPRHSEAEAMNAVEYPLALELRKARAALARWGRPTPQPVAVSERLPGPEHCTARGLCWVFYKGYATWTLEPPLGQDGKHAGYTHWLPANALPTPEATND